MSDEMDKFELELKDPEKALWVARKTFSRRQVLAGAAGAAAAAALAGTVLAQVMPDDTSKVQGAPATDLSKGRSPFEQPKRRVGGVYAGIPQTSSTNQANFMGVITPSDMHVARHHAGIPQIDPKR
ncbi:MAG: hypothetical protein AAB270_02640, partial [Chloroflexota bacterium]